MVLERATFIEVVLFNDMRLVSPVAAICECYEHYLEADFANFLFERTSYDELMNILVKSVRFGDDDDDDGEVFAEFVARMREQ